MSTPSTVQLRRGRQDRYHRNKPTTWTPISVSSYGPTTTSTNLILTCRRGDEILAIQLSPAVRAAIHDLDRQFTESPRNSATINVAGFDN